MQILDGVLTSCSLPVYNLANGVDVDQTRAKMDAYKKDNQTLIMKNRDRQVTYLILCNVASDKLHVKDIAAC